jgi:hypothetical protein
MREQVKWQWCMIDGFVEENIIENHANVLLFFIKLLWLEEKFP